MEHANQSVSHTHVSPQGEQEQVTDFFSTVKKNQYVRLLKKHKQRLLAVLLFLLLLTIVVTIAIGSQNVLTSNAAITPTPAIPTPSTVPPTATATLTPTSTPIPTARPTRKPTATPTITSSVSTTPEANVTASPSADTEGPVVSGINGPYDWGKQGICFVINGDQVKDNVKGQTLSFSWKFDHEEWDPFVENQVIKCYVGRTSLSPGSEHDISIRVKDKAGNISNEFTRHYTMIH